MTTQREQVIAEMKSGGPKLPSDLAVATGVPKGSVYAVLSDLKHEGKVSGDGKVGYRLNPAEVIAIQAGATHDAIKVCEALLCDDPNWTPMPRPLLEEVSSVRGERMTLALQELLVKRAIKYTSNGYIIDDIAIANVVIGKSKVVEPPSYSHEQPSAVTVKRVEPKVVEVRYEQPPKADLRPANFDRFGPSEPNNIEADLRPVPVQVPTAVIHFSLRDDGVLSFYANGVLQLELPAVDTKRLRKFLACFSEEE